jgi:catechol 2,3-dioxygenase-like lactoylglutathione lyase family enzyme
MVTLTKTIPALPMRDVGKAVDFYRDRLGFEVVHQDDVFAFLARDEATLHLWEADDESWRQRDSLESPVRSGAESFIAGTASCRIRVAGVDELYEEMRGSGVLHTTANELTNTEFGTREFHTLDLDGNLVTFYEETGA